VTKDFKRVERNWALSAALIHRCWRKYVRGQLGQRGDRLFDPAILMLSSALDALIELRHKGIYVSARNC
jgi:hypothetical protein